MERAKPSQDQANYANHAEPNEASQGPRPSGGKKDERKKTGKEGREEEQKEEGHAQHAKCSQLKPRERDRIKHTCRAQNSAKKILVQSVSRYAHEGRCSEESASEVRFLASCFPTKGSKTGSPLCLPGRRETLEVT